MNPDRPYEDPRVTIHVDDGRAFLEQSRKRYDLILFALPDSLALISGQSSLRLESYLFTVEAARSVRAHLSPRGAFGMYNFYREDWLVDRYALTLKVAFGHAPCVNTVGWAGRFAVLVVGRQVNDVACRRIWIPGPRAVPEPANDDHPFPYLRSRSIPPLYLSTIGLLLLVSLIAVRLAGGPLKQMRSYTDLFFMGAAFLLLETKNVVQFALLFGTTWLVNALVFLGILLAVLLAIELAQRVTFRKPEFLYIALLASLIVAWNVPQDSLLSLNAPLRFVAAAALAFAPIFLANLIFAQRFRQAESSTAAFAANLLGAMVGGILEYSSLLFGYRALLILVAVLYGCAFVFGRKNLSVNAAEVTRPIGPLTAIDP